MAGRSPRHRPPRRKGRAASDGERRQLARASRRARRAPAGGPAVGEWPWVLCDGGSRGNPGPAAVAAVLVAPGGAVVESRCAAIGAATAAVAEYRAILLGLDLAAERAADPLEIRSDSRLAISAIQTHLPGDTTLAALVADIRTAARRFSAVRWRWHPRHDNDAADALVRDLLWG